MRSIAVENQYVSRLQRNAATPGRWQLVLDNTEHTVAVNFMRKRPRPRAGNHLEGSRAFIHCAERHPTRQADAAAARGARTDDVLVPWMVNTRKRRNNSAGTDDLSRAHGWR